MLQQQVTAFPRPNLDESRSLQFADHLTSGLRELDLRLQYGVEEEQVGEQCAQVNGSVQVVYELRAERWLREHELNGRLRPARVIFDHADERVIGLRRLPVEPSNTVGDSLGQTRERSVALAEEVADLAARYAPGLVWQALRGVRQHELVRLFDGITARREIGQRLVGRRLRHARRRRWRRVAVHVWLVGGLAGTGQRSGS